MKQVIVFGKSAGIVHDACLAHAFVQHLDLAPLGWRHRERCQSGTSCFDLPHRNEQIFELGRRDFCDDRAPPGPDLDQTGSG